MIGVASGMQDLHADATAGFMYCPGQLAVTGQLQAIGELGSKGCQATPPVGGNAAGDHQARSPPRPLDEIGGETIPVPDAIFQARMHGPHENAVGQGGKAQIQGLQNIGIGWLWHGGFGFVGLIGCLSLVGLNPANQSPECSEKSASNQP
jgi:hypothetical protein